MTWSKNLAVFAAGHLVLASCSRHGTHGTDALSYVKMRTPSSEIAYGVLHGCPVIGMDTSGVRASFGRPIRRSSSDDTWVFTVGKPEGFLRTVLRSGHLAHWDVDLPPGWSPGGEHFIEQRRVYGVREFIQQHPGTVDRLIYAMFYGCPSSGFKTQHLRAVWGPHLRVDTLEADPPTRTLWTLATGVEGQALRALVVADSVVSWCVRDPYTGASERATRECGFPISRSPFGGREEPALTMQERFKRSPGADSLDISFMGGSRSCSRGRTAST